MAASVLPAPPAYPNRVSLPNCRRMGGSVSRALRTGPTRVRARTATAEPSTMTVVMIAATSFPRLVSANEAFSFQRGLTPFEGARGGQMLPLVHRVLNTLGRLHLREDPDPVLDRRVRREQLLQPRVALTRHTRGLRQPQVCGGIVG